MSHLYLASVAYNTYCWHSIFGQVCIYMYISTSEYRINLPSAVWHTLHNMRLCSIYLYTIWHGAHIRMPPHGPHGPDLRMPHMDLMEQTLGCPHMDLMDQTLGCPHMDLMDQTLGCPHMDLMGQALGCPHMDLVEQTLGCPHMDLMD